MSHQRLPSDLTAAILETVRASMDGVVLCRADGDHRVVHISGDAVAALTRLSSLAVAPGPWDLDVGGPAVGTLLPPEVAQEILTGISRVGRSERRFEAVAPLRDHEGNITGYLLYVLSKVRDLVILAFREIPAGLGAFEPEEVLVSAQGLRTALRNGELILYAQPVVDVPTGRTAGAEMLVRWRHPTRGLLAPADFLSVAETSDLMEELGAWVIDRAVAQTARWEHARGGLDYFRVGVNVSPRQLTHCDIVGELRAALHRYNTSPDNLLVEIVENPVLDSRTAAADQLRALLDLGVRVGIDDFGAGFANMTYLRDLPIDMIKVDRALMGLEPTRRDEMLLTAVQTIAEAIGADVVLEGVERAVQFDVARRCGVRFAQGYLLGRPVVPGELPPIGVAPATVGIDLPGLGLRAD